MLDFTIVIDSLPKLVKAIPVTLSIFFNVVVIGLLIGVTTALVYRRHSRLMNVVIDTYITVFRGTPALIQVFIIYYGFGQFETVRDSFLWPVLREPYYCIIIALGLNAGAYSAKIIMGALSSVPPGLIEGGKALGLSRFSILRKIEFPLALRMALPALGNDTILNLKATSLASTVTIMELTGSARLLVSDTYAPYEVFLTAGIVYFALTFVLIKLFAALEKRLNKRMGRADSNPQTRPSILKKTIGIGAK